MVRLLTESERALIGAMMTSAKAVDPERLPRATSWQGWRQDLHRLLGRLSVGDPCDCGICPSFQLLVDGQTVPIGEAPIIFEAFVPDAIVMLFVHEGYPSYLEIAPNRDAKVDLPAVSALIF